MLCLCIGTIYYNLDDSWKASYNRAALIFFTVSFIVSSTHPSKMLFVVNS